MKKSKTKLKSVKEPRALIAIRVNSEERKKIETLATFFTEGNLSEWVRYAALHFKPGKADIAAKLGEQLGVKKGGGS